MSCSTKSRLPLITLCPLLSIHKTKLSATKEAMSVNFTNSDKNQNDIDDNPNVEEDFQSGHA